MPNGSFEEYNWCPDYDNGFYINACKYWTMPTLGSSDYFNRCSTFWDSFLNRYMFSVPENYIGYQEARTGDGYAGIVFTQNILEGEKHKYNTPYSEYIQVRLKKKLEDGKLYHLQFFVNYTGPEGGNFDYAICPNSIGALFTSTELHENHDSIIQMTSQYNSDLSLFFCDTTKWYELNYTFQAQGNENYLTIGVFTPMPLTKVTDISGDTISPQADRYYYIDDVSVKEVDYLTTIKDKIPNVFTPNDDGVNDLFSLDKLDIEPQSISIVNRWGNIVYQSKLNFAWDGTYQGRKCTDGVYFYVIQFTKEIKINGFVHLIR